MHRGGGWKTCGIGKYNQDQRERIEMTRLCCKAIQIFIQLLSSGQFIKKKQKTTQTCIVWTHEG